MPVFIEARTDPFEDLRTAEAGRARDRARPRSVVRRPTRGYEIKEDSYAMLRVVLRDGSFLPVLDSGGVVVNENGGQGYTTKYSNFIVQNVVEQRQEKQQIVESFGDTYIFFYGESPRVTQVTGFLLNSNDFNWRAEWWENYERYFRGTRLVENGARLYFIYDDLIIEGYMLSASISEEVQNNPLLQLQFTLFVTGYTNVSHIGGTDFPRPPGDVDYSQPVSYSTALAAAQDREKRTVQRELTGDAVRRANEIGYFGSRTLLTDAWRQGLISDPAVSGFLARTQGALLGYITQQLPTDVPITPSELSKWGKSELKKMLGRQFAPASRALRSKISDNQDEYIGLDLSEAESTASASLSMADKWLTMDRNMDGLLGELGINLSDRGVYDLMGRAGRSLEESGKKVGPREGGNEISFGPARTLAPSSIRQVPFGLITTE